MEKNGSEAATVEMTLTAYMENEMKKIFEIEMLQGERRVLPDGRIEYKITIHDEQKAEAVMTGMLQLFKDKNHSDN